MKAILIVLLLISAPTFATEFDCTASDKEIARELLDNSRAFSDDRVSIEMVKKQEIITFDFKFKSKISYCINAGTPMINWDLTRDVELEEDGNKSTKCVSTSTGMGD